MGADGERAPVGDGGGQRQRAVRRGDGDAVYDLIGARPLLAADHHVVAAVVVDVAQYVDEHGAQLVRGVHADRRDVRARHRGIDRRAGRAARRVDDRGAVLGRHEQIADTVIVDVARGGQAGVEHDAAETDAEVVPDAGDREAAVAQHRGVHGGAVDAAEHDGDAVVAHQSNVSEAVTVDVARPAERVPELGGEDLEAAQPERVAGARQRAGEGDIDRAGVRRPAVLEPRRDVLAAVAVEVADVAEGHPRRAMRGRRVRGIGDLLLAEHPGHRRRCCLRHRRRRESQYCQPNRYSYTSLHARKPSGARRSGFATAYARPLARPESTRGSQRLATALGEIACASGVKAPGIVDQRRYGIPPARPTPAGRRR